MQVASMLAKADFSEALTLSEYTDFTLIHIRLGVHQYEVSKGFHKSGDLSPLAELTLSVTAISWGLVRSLAKAWRSGLSRRQSILR